MDEIIKRITDACVTKVVAISVVKGNGDPEHPIDLVTKYYTEEGKYIGEIRCQDNYEEK